MRFDIIDFFLVLQGLEESFMSMGMMKTMARTENSKPPADPTANENQKRSS